MNSRSISPKAHSMIDYALVESLLLFPSILGMNKKARRLYATEALILLPYVAITEQPVALKSLIRFRTHGKIDLFNLSQVAFQSFLKPFKRDSKALIFNIAFTAIAGATGMLTDWSRKTSR